MEPSTARSRFTFEPSARDPRFVRRRVSGAMPTLKAEVPCSSVMVRHVPLMAMLSPRSAPERKVVVPGVMRALQPEPPVEVASCWRREVMAA